MKTPPYCDYCGEEIHNWKNMEYGDDIAFAIQEKTMNGFWNKFVLFGIQIMGLIWYPFGGRPCFCNQKHKDKFAKRIGLKRRGLTLS